MCLWSVLIYFRISGGALALLLSMLNIGLLGYVVIVILYVGEHTLYPFISETLNYHASEQQRATLLSVASFLKTAPYIALGPIIGSLSTHHHLGYFLSVWAMLIGVAVWVYLFALRKRDPMIKIPVTQ